MRWILARLSSPALILVLLAACAPAPASSPPASPTAAPAAAPAATALASPAAQKPAALERVVIATSTRTRSPGFSNMWIGRGFGFYEELGLDAVIEGTSGHNENLQLLLSDQVNLSVGVQDTVLAAQAKGEVMPVVFPCNYLRGIIYRVVVKPDSPVKSFGDLAGKRVGVQSLAAASVNYVKFAMRAANADPESVSFVAVGTGQQAAVALGRDVDALATSDVEQVQFGNLGVQVRMLAQPPAVENLTAGHVFAFHKPWYDRHKSEVVRTLQGMIKSIILMLENPEAAVRMSFKMYPESVPMGKPLDEAVKDAVEEIKVRAPLLAKERGQVKRWCEFAPDAWKDYTALLGLEGKADPSVFYTNELIEQINNFDQEQFRQWARSVKVS